MAKSPKASDIDADAVRKLADLLNETGLTEIEYTYEDWSLRVSKGATAVAATVPAAAAPAAADSGAADQGVVGILSQLTDALQEFEEDHNVDKLGTDAEKRADARTVTEQLQALEEADKAMLSGVGAQAWEYHERGPSDRNREGKEEDQNEETKTWWWVAPYKESFTEPRRGPPPKRVPKGRHLGSQNGAKIDPKTIQNRSRFSRTKKYPSRPSWNRLGAVLARSWAILTGRGAIL